METVHTISTWRAFIKAVYYECDGTYTYAVSESSGCYKLREGPWHQVPNVLDN
jgi:hypothetical protein